MLPRLSLQRATQERDAGWEAPRPGRRGRAPQASRAGEVLTGQLCGASGVLFARSSERRRDSVKWTPGPDHVCWPCCPRASVLSSSRTLSALPTRNLRPGKKTSCMKPT